jgi:hypothetical protein
LQDTYLPSVCFTARQWRQPTSLVLPATSFYGRRRRTLEPLGLTRLLEGIVAHARVGEWGQRRSPHALLLDRMSPSRKRLLQLTLSCRSSPLSSPVRGKDREFANVARNRQGTDRHLRCGPFGATLAESPRWVTSAIDAVGAILVAVDQVGLPFRIDQSSSLYTGAEVKYYFETYGHYDEPTMTQWLAATPPLHVLRDRDVWGDMTKLENRPDYAFVRQRYGIRRRAGVRLSQDKGWMDLLALQFNRDWPDLAAAKLGRLGELLPHLTKVVEIHRTFAILRQKFNAVLAALDDVRIGTCVVAPSGHVIVSNREAKRIYDLKHGIHLAEFGDG